jgi:hypothetical protein
MAVWRNCPLVQGVCKSDGLPADQEISLVVFTAMIVQIVVFWVVTSYIVIGKYVSEEYAASIFIVEEHIYTLVMEAACYPETSISAYKFTRNHNPEDHNLKAIPQFFGIRCFILVFKHARHWTISSSR